MDFWTDLPSEVKPFMVFAAIAAAILIWLLFAAIRDGSHSMLLSADELKRDRAARDRRKALKVLQRRQQGRRSVNP